MTDSRFKILMLNHEFPPVGGGASPVTFELCKQLANMGHQVDVVTMSYGTLPKFERVDGFNIYRTPALRRRPDVCYMHELATYLPGALFKTLSLAKKNHYDVIHCHFIVPGGLLAYIVHKFTGIPTIITCHGSDVPGYNPDRFRFVYKIIKPIWRFFASAATLLTSPSQSLRQLILKNAPDVEVDIVPNAIYPEKFKSSQKQNRILMCSRVFKRKGFQYVIQALSELRLENWEICLIGDGPYLNEIKKLAADKKVPVVFRGWLKNDDPRFYELFNTSSIFVFTSEAENFPTVLLEALSAGMAIITSNAGGCPEIVGDAAMLVEPRNSDQIKKCLAELIGSEELRQKFSNAALARSQEFAWPAVAGKYIDCYKKIIAGGKKT